MDKNPDHTCWLLCTVGVAYTYNAYNGTVANDNMDGGYVSAKPASPAHDVDRSAVSKTDITPTTEIIFTSSVLSGAITRQDQFRKREPANTDWHDTTEELFRCKP
jgi:hypothetical protein